MSGPEKAVLPGPGLDVSGYVQRVGEQYVAIGEYSDLWMGDFVNNMTGETSRVAIKVLRGGSTTNPAFIKNVTKNLTAHARTWIKLNHPNVIQFFGIAMNCGYMPALVLPYYSKGNIVNFLQKTSTSNLEKLALVKEVAQGLNFLHNFSPMVVHGDLRGANILIDDEGHARLADFGLVFIIDPSDFTSAKTAGACRWTAPEVLNPSEENLNADNPPPLYTTASDIYAYAMVVLEIYSGQVPFSDKKNDSVVIFMILKDKRPELPPYLKSENHTLLKLVQMCWDKDPSKRPSAKSVLDNLEHATSPNLRTSYFDWVQRVVNFFWPG